MASVVLVLPPNTRASCLNDWIMRLYTAYVYRVLCREEFKVEFRDYLDKARGFRQEISLSVSKKYSGPRTYGIAMFVGNKKNALWLMRKIRAQDPEGRIVAFGPFAASFYSHILQQGLADIVILFDAEFVFPDICNTSNSYESIPNLAYLQSGNILLSPRKSFVDLDSLPYVGQYFAEKRLFRVPVVTARGCPYACSFCDRPTLWGPRLIQRSVENVFGEIDFLVRNYGTQKFFFADANFIITKGRTERLCRALLQLPAKIVWDCSARVDCADPRVFRLMRQAGCYRVYFGVESGDLRVLQNFGKKYGRKEILQAVQWARDAGLTVGIFLIVGTPGESRQSLNKTKQLLLELYPFSELTVNPLVILPGTPMYIEMVRKGIIREDDYFEQDGLMLFDREKQLYLQDLSSLERFLER